MEHKETAEERKKRLAKERKQRYKAKHQDVREVFFWNTKVMKEEEVKKMKR